MIPRRLAERLSGGGQLAFSEFVELALYDPDDGFYAGEGRAGRRGDFLTSPEVGPLFGALVARYLDQVWDRLGRPDPFVVIEVGAGPGTLARTVRVADPACAGSLVYVLVEVSAAQRARHAEHLPGWVGERAGAELEATVAAPRRGQAPLFVSAARGPGAPVDGVVLANELLDNLPFDLVRRVGAGAEEMVVVLDEEGGLDLTVRPAGPVVVAGLVALDAPDGEWLPWQDRTRRWLAEARAGLRAGAVLVVDYGGGTRWVASRAGLGWLRTYRGNQRGGHPLDEPGTQDVTADVDLDQLQSDRRADVVVRQAAWLRSLGIDELVEEGRRIWDERAHAPDLVAVRGRSRVREAEALLDRQGLGDFWVLEWRVGPTASLPAGPGAPPPTDPPTTGGGNLGRAAGGTGDTT